MHKKSSINTNNVEEALATCVNGLSVGSWHLCGRHLTHTTYSNTVADQVYPLMTAALPSDSGPLTRTERPATLSGRAWGQDRELKVLAWPPNSPDPDLRQRLWMCRNTFDPWRPHPLNLHDLKDPAQDAPRSFKTMQMVQSCFAWGNLQNIKQVVLTFWLISVHTRLYI